MELNDKKFAVLIDADNISHRKIKDRHLYTLMYQTKNRMSYMQR